MNTNFQTIHQMGGAISDFVKQATGRDNVQNIDMDHVTVAQNHVYDEVDVSGRVVQFSAGEAGLTFEKLLVQIEPVQDLHGYDHPWPAGGGKNKLKNNLTSGNINGLTVAVDADGVISFSGTATEITIINVNANIDTEFSKGISYILSGCTGGSLATYRFEMYKRVGNNAVNYNGDTQFQLEDTDSGCVCRIVILSGINMSGVKIYPMIRLATETDATYAPYSNICPITGWTMVNLYQAGQNLENARVFRFTFPSEAGNVYSGTFDVISGKLIIDMFLYVYDGTESFTKSPAALNGFYNNLTGSTPHNWPRMFNYSSEKTVGNAKSSMFIPTRSSTPYLNTYGMLYLDSGHNFNVDPDIFGTTVNSFKEKLTELYEAGTPVSVLTRIATPITYTLTPQEITTLLGQNNIWADTGDIEVKFTNLKELY